MNVEDKFILVAGLICEPTRAKMLWSLLDGRAYIASELAASSSISVTSASNHLAKLLDADIIKFEMQGRHRYYSFANAEVAYVVEAMANLAGNKLSSSQKVETVKTGMKYCRTCYDHLAGFVGVTITEAMEHSGYIKKEDSVYLVTAKGWKWFEQFDILKTELTNARRPLTRQCLDWSERRPHLAGQLGAVFFEKLVQRNWFRKVQFSRALLITAKGSQQAYELLGISLT
jgi:DNA-binding transcriptional ArsR family regulator